MFFLQYHNGFLSYHSVLLVELSNLTMVKHFLMEAISKNVLSSLGQIIQPQVYWCILGKKKLVTYAGTWYQVWLALLRHSKIKTAKIPDYRVHDLTTQAIMEVKDRFLDVSWCILCKKTSRQCR